MANKKVHEVGLWHILRLETRDRCLGEVDAYLRPKEKEILYMAPNAATTA